MKNTKQMINNGVKYKMSEQMARELLRERKGADAKMNPNEYLCKFVNEQFSIKGVCVEVSRI